MESDAVLALFDVEGSRGQCNKKNTTTMCTFQLACCRKFCDKEFVRLRRRLKPEERKRVRRPRTRSLAVSTTV